MVNQNPTTRRSCRKRATPLSRRYVEGLMAGDDAEAYRRLAVYAMQERCREKRRADAEKRRADAFEMMLTKFLKYLDTDRQEQARKQAMAEHHKALGGRFWVFLALYDWLELAVVPLPYTWPELIDELIKLTRIPCQHAVPLWISEDMRREAGLTDTRGLVVNEELLKEGLTRVAFLRAYHTSKPFPESSSEWRRIRKSDPVLSRTLHDRRGRRGRRGNSQRKVP